MRVYAFYMVWGTLLALAVRGYLSADSSEDDSGRDAVAEIVSVDGRGYRKRTQDYVWQDASPRQLLGNDSVVATAAKSRLVVRLRSGYELLIEEQSQIALQEKGVGSRDVVMVVYRGDVEVRPTAKHSSAKTVLKAHGYQTLLTHKRGGVKVVRDVEGDLTAMTVSGGATASVKDAAGRPVLSLSAHAPRFANRIESGATPAPDAKPSPAPRGVDPGPKSPVRAPPPRFHPPGRYFAGSGGAPPEFVIEGRDPLSKAFAGNRRLEVDGQRIRFRAKDIKAVLGRTVEVKAETSAGPWGVGSYVLLDEKSFRGPIEVVIGPKSESDWIQLGVRSGTNVQMDARLLPRVAQLFDVLEARPSADRIDRGWFVLSDERIVASAPASADPSEIRRLSRAISGNLAFRGRRGAMMTRSEVDQAFKRMSGSVFFLTNGLAVPVDWKLLRSRPGAADIIRSGRYFFSERVEIDAP